MNWVVVNLAKEYKDEIVGGDGKRRYDLVRGDGSKALENVQIVKAYTPEQEGTEFGASDVLNLQSRTVTVTATAAGWTGNVKPYTQVLTVNGMTATCNAIVGLADSATEEQRTAARRAGIVPVAQAAGKVTLKADYAAPSVDLPVAVTILEVK